MYLKLLLFNYKTAYYKTGSAGEYSKSDHDLNFKQKCF